MMDDLVFSIDSPKATLATVGGKAENLAQLVLAGFPVPPGFLITTAAYREFVQANDLQRRIVALARSGAGTDYEVASAEIRRLFERGRVPPQVAAAIRQAYASFRRKGEAPGPVAVRCSECHCCDLEHGSAGEEVPMAVRSSATAEDLPGASFAGQQETYLNVADEEEVLRAVKRCWSSLWTPRALAYRARQGIDPDTVSLAVVVQEMVDASAAGVLFTANPLTGARDDVVIDAAWGLGEAVVSGLVTPDHIVADKATGKVKQMAVADKAVLTATTAGGTDERAVEANRRGSAVLDAAQVAELVRLGAAVEAHYRAPQDIEWCLADGRFWIVQSRPVTTLPPEPVHWDSPVPGAKWMNDLQAAEWATEPLSPLGATTTFATMITARQRKFRMQKSPWYALINGWLYIRADYRLLTTVGRCAWWISRLAVGTTDGHRRVRRTWPSHLAVLDCLENIDLAKLPDAGLYAQAGRLLKELGWWWWEVSWGPAVVILSEQLIRKLGVPALTDPVVLFRGNDSLLLEAERALRYAAETGEVDAYLARFGHFVESADPLHPTLRESPEILNQYLAMARRSETRPDERLMRSRRERTEAELRVRAVRGARGMVARRVLKAGQSHAAHVDDTVFHFQRVLALLRATYLEAGRRLARAGALERPEDVFYLKRCELRGGRPAGQTFCLRRRRELRERQKKLAPPPFIPPPSDPAWDRDPMLRIFSSIMGKTVIRRGTQERHGRRVLVGTPGSPGRARGVARLIGGPGDFHRFHPGDVLVAHATTPVWTPLFNIASAAVTEVGGNFSHAAIVAREFGIPLVNGALDATRDIVDGTPILVDGSAGLVEL
jgi:phosphohistidine swiveling domain-containing protein